MNKGTKKTKREGRKRSKDEKMEDESSTPDREKMQRIEEQLAAWAGIEGDGNGNVPIKHFLVQKTVEDAVSRWSSTTYLGSPKIPNSTKSRGIMSLILLFYYF